MVQESPVVTEQQLRGQLAAARQEALQAISEAGSSAALEDIRVRYLGKKGVVTLLLRGLGNLAPEARPLAGRLVNELRDEIESALTSRKTAIAQEELAHRLAAERLDVTLPGRRTPRGSRHPLTLTLDEIKRVFVGLGFEVAETREIELDYYNFQALNIPVEHAARDMQDTFYITDEILLRTHTSPGQIRTMEQRRPPVRAIFPGKVYRVDADATHSPMFHQVEGLLVDEGVTFGDLKGTLALFARELFGPERGVRFRPSYFPFTEPSAEMDITCGICHGSGCRACGNEGWLEILGSGMVHPKVLENVGYDPERVSGFAFGMGVERIAMLRYGIDDIRLFFENDVRFLSQF